MLSFSYSFSNEITYQTRSSFIGWQYRVLSYSYFDWSAHYKGIVISVQYIFLNFAFDLYWELRSVLFCGFAALVVDSNTLLTHNYRRSDVEFGY